MYIKAYSARTYKNLSKPQQQLNYYTILHSSQPNHQEPVPAEDRIFTDDTWFNRLSIVPHIENHRPVMKRRILKIKQQARNSIINVCSLPDKQDKQAKNNKLSVTKNSFTFTPIKMGSKKQINSQMGKNKFISVKHSIVRQMSEVPDYVRNIMKPCKIQAMTICHRPSTGRKPSTTASRVWKQRNSERVSPRAESVNHDLFDGFKSSTKIEPWEQTNQQFHIY